MAIQEWSEAMTTAELQEKYEAAETPQDIIALAREAQAANVPDTPLSRGLYDLANRFLAIQLLV